MGKGPRLYTVYDILTHIPLCIFYLALLVSHSTAMKRIKPNQNNVLKFFVTWYLNRMQIVTLIKVCMSYRQLPIMSEACKMKRTFEI